MTRGESLVQEFLFSFANVVILGHLYFLEGFNPYKPAHHNEYHRPTIEAYNLALVALGLAWVYLMTPKQVTSLSGVFFTDGWWSGFGLDPDESNQLDKFN